MTGFFRSWGSWFFFLTAVGVLQLCAAVFARAASAADPVDGRPRASQCASLLDAESADSPGPERALTPDHTLFKGRPLADASMLDLILTLQGKYAGYGPFEEIEKMRDLGEAVIRIPLWRSQLVALQAWMKRAHLEWRPLGHLGHGYASAAAVLASKSPDDVREIEVRGDRHALLELLFVAAPTDTQPVFESVAGANRALRFIRRYGDAGLQRGESIQKFDDALYAALIPARERGLFERADVILSEEELGEKGFQGASDPGLFWFIIRFAPGSTEESALHALDEANARDRELQVRAFGIHGGRFIAEVRGNVASLVALHRLKEVGRLELPEPETRRALSPIGKFFSWFKRKPGSK